MKRQYYLVALIGIGLSILLAMAVHRSIPAEVFSAVDPGFDWDEQGNDLQVALSYGDSESAFAVSVKNVSAKVVSLRARLRAADSENHDVGERGEGAFQLFLVNSAGEKVSLHQYANRQGAAVTEIDVPLNPGQAEIFHYHSLPGDNDLERIGNHGLVAGVRYFEWDPRAPSTMSDEDKAKIKSYVAWSDVVYLPDAQ